MGVRTAIWSAAKFMVGVHPIQKRGAARARGSIYGGIKVHFRRQWNDRRIATAQWSDLSNPHWDIVSGGTQTKAPQPFIHAYVLCDKIKGNIAHSCNHGPGPHNIKVCLVKKRQLKRGLELPDEDRWQETAKGFLRGEMRGTTGWGESLALAISAP